MFRGKTIFLIAVSIVCTMGAVFGATLHLIYAKDLEDLVRTKHIKQNVALITLYLQIPQHLLEIVAVVLLICGLIQSKRQLMLPWLIINALGIGLYSTILLVLGMIISGYFFCGYFLISGYAYFWYQIQCHYTTILTQEGDNSNINYTPMIE